MTMNRNSAKDSLVGIGARNLHSNNVSRTGLSSHRRVMSFTSTTTTTTTEDFNSNNIDLFSRNRRSLSVASSDESDLQVRLRRLSVGSTKPAKNELELDDLISSNEGGKHDYDWLLTPPGTPLLPSSDVKESQPKSVAPRRISSAKLGSTIQNSRLSPSQSDSINPSKPARSSSATRSAITTAQNANRNPNILNTSSASVSSYIRPSTPNRSSTAARPSTPRASTPSRTRPSTTARPSTPTSPAVRPASRSSTPTRRSPTPSATSSPSTARAISSNGRNPGPTSRPSSPGPRVRPPPQPIVPPDFPHETPPNLRTTLPERPLSAGRSRPGPAMTVDSTNSRRQPSPVVARGRPNSNGQSESLTKKPTKTSNSDGGTGFGRSISKKSLDMAIKHMDIKSGGIRPSALFPQSIRSGNPRLASTKPGFKNGSSFSCKIMDADIYESSRYDAILLKEDLNNTSWLHSAEEKSDELFDNGFEPLPEPFAPF